VGALAVVGTIGYTVMHRATSLSTRPSPIPSTLVTASAVPVLPPAMLSAVVPSSTLPSPVKLRVSTDPDGASVKENGVELCSSTPCDILYEGDDAEPGREHKLSVSRQGYRLEVRSVRVGEGPISAKLTPLSRAPASVPAKPADMPTVPTGYKTDIPY
jgi:PEGA domain-containing protein